MNKLYTSSEVVEELSSSVPMYTFMKVAIYKNLMP